MKQCQAVLTKKANAIGILLGGGITDEGLLPYDVQTRADKAIELLKGKYLKKLIITGGCSNPKFQKKTEAKLIKSYLIKKSIKKSAIILEEQARDTIGNAVYAKEIILKKKLPKNIVIITSNYHIKRALRLFEHVFGDRYIFFGVSSKPTLAHRMQMMLREWEMKEIETVLLSTIARGEHNKAKKFMCEFVPRYK